MHGFHAASYPWFMARVTRGKLPVASQQVLVCLPLAWHLSRCLCACLWRGISAGACVSACGAASQHVLVCLPVAQHLSMCNWHMLHQTLNCLPQCPFNALWAACMHALIKQHVFVCLPYTYGWVGRS